MKRYIKPSLEYVKLTVEEQFAHGSHCVPTGFCSVSDPKHPGKRIKLYTL